MQRNKQHALSEETRRLTIPGGVLEGTSPSDEGYQTSVSNHKLSGGQGFA